MTQDRYEKVLFFAIFIATSSIIFSIFHGNKTIMEISIAEIIIVFWISLFNSILILIIGKIVDKIGD